MYSYYYTLNVIISQWDVLYIMGYYPTLYNVQNNLVINALMLYSCTTV